MELRPDPLCLGELSTVRVHFSLGRTSWGDGWNILIVKYSGVCRSGRAGRYDARYMHAMAAAGEAAWEPGGIVLDLSELEFDDSRPESRSHERFFWVSSLGDEGVPLPLAIVVGPEGERAGRVLYGDADGRDPFEAHDWNFRDVNTAWAWVLEEVGEQWKGFHRPTRR